MNKNSPVDAAERLLHLGLAVHPNVPLHPPHCLPSCNYIHQGGLTSATGPHQRCQHPRLEVTADSLEQSQLFRRSSCLALLLIASVLGLAFLDDRVGHGNEVLEVAETQCGGLETYLGLDGVHAVA